MNDLEKKTITRLTRELGPIALHDLFQELAEDTSNNWKIVSKFDLSLWTVKLLRANLNWAVRYLLKEQESKIIGSIKKVPRFPGEASESAGFSTVRTGPRSSEVLENLKSQNCQ